MKKTIREILINTLYAILIIAYIICLNTQGKLLSTKVLNQYINISSLVFLGIAIIYFEIGYRRKIKNIIVNGIEFLILAFSTLIITYIPKAFKYDMYEYTKIIAYLFVTYYIIKSAITYTISMYTKLKQLSDIKEIVKEEPTKKETKRKNQKTENIIEEGN